MPKLVPISARRIIRILERIGYRAVQIHGSHHFFMYQENRKTATVPVHGNETLGVGVD